MAFVERKLRNLLWDTPGNKAQGMLTSVTPVRFQDGGTNLAYTLKDGAEMVVFQGATALNYLLSRSDVGKQIYVEYVGVDESRQMSQGKNRPKMFKVMVDEGSAAPPVTAADGNGITDEGIPF